MANYSNNGQSNHPERPIIPATENQQMHTKNIERLVAGFLSKHCGIFINRDYVYSTIATDFLGAIIDRLSDKMTMPGIAQEVNIFNVLRIVPSVKFNSEAEKEGNINLVIRHDFVNSPSILEDLVGCLGAQADDGQVYPLLPPLSPIQSEDYKSAEHLALLVLQRQRNINICSQYMVSTVAAVYVVAIIEYLIQTAVATKKGVMYNMNDVMEANCSLNSKGIPEVRFVPGQNAKTTIKRDSRTEAE